MRGIKFKICKLVPYMPYQNCKNVNCLTFKGCCHISPVEKIYKDYNKERLEMLRNFEKYRLKVIEVNNSTLNEDASPADRE